MARHHRLNSTNGVHARPDGSMSNDRTVFASRIVDGFWSRVPLRSTTQQRAAAKRSANAKRRRRDRTVSEG